MDIYFKHSGILISQDLVEKLFGLDIKDGHLNFLAKFMTNDMRGIIKKNKLPETCVEKLDPIWFGFAWRACFCGYITRNTLRDTVESLLVKKYD